MLQTQQLVDRPKLRRSSTMKTPQDRAGYLKKARQRALAENICIKNLSIEKIPNIKVHLEDPKSLSQPAGDD